MKSLQEISDKALKARYRKELRDLKARVRRNDPIHVVHVVGYAALATKTELERRGIDYTPREFAKGE